MNSHNKFDLLQSVKDPLGLYVLVILVVDASLIGISTRVDGVAQVVAIAGSVGLLATLVMVVATTAWKNPDALRQPVWLTRSLRESRRLNGYWWQTLSGSSETTLSLIEISAQRGALSVTGRTYQHDGTWLARWRTSASFLDPDTRSLHYHWTGEHPSEPNRSFEGFGSIIFNASFDSGHGDFIDIDRVNWSEALRRFADYSRCTPALANQFEQLGQSGRARFIRERISE